MLRRDESSTPQQAGLNLTLRFRDLILYGVILIQPPAPHAELWRDQLPRLMDHVVTPILLAMIAMLLTSSSYGRMARIYSYGGLLFYMSESRYTRPRISHLE